MTTVGSTPEADRLPVDEPETSATSPESRVEQGRRLTVGGRELGVGQREFGLAFLAAAVGLVGYGTALAVSGTQSGVLATLGTVGALVFLAGVSSGLVGVWLHYAGESRLAKAAIVVSVVSSAGFVATEIGLDLGVLAIAFVLGIPAGLSMLGVALRRSIGSAAWLSLIAALPLVLTGGVVWVIGLVVDVGMVATVGGLLAALGFLSVVPLGVEMIRTRSDAGVGTAVAPEPEV